jgi:hypothetical protein
MDQQAPEMFELCRYLAFTNREEVLATVAERRVSVPPEWEEILVLDDWHHPDLCNNERPSQTETFRQLAQVLRTGDVSFHRPTEVANTRWIHWPEGGGL